MGRGKEVGREPRSLLATGLSEAVLPCVVIHLAQASLVESCDLQTKVPQPRLIPLLTSCRGVDKKAQWISQGHEKLGEHVEFSGLCN